MNETVSQREPSFIKRNKGALVAIIFGLLTIIGSIFIIYVNTYAKADETAIQTLNNSKLVDITIDGALVIMQPPDTEVNTGIIFYPGGKVEAHSYAPLLEALANEGYLAVIYQMPYNLAVFGMNAAADVIKRFPEIDHWYIGGHSLGGAMAYSDAPRTLGWLRLS